MEHEVYICYDDKDLSIAREVIRLFEENNIQCWFKVRDIGKFDSNTAMSDRWSQFDDTDNLGSVKDAIRYSNLFVLILSENSTNSNHVKNEVNLAFSYEIPIITFKIDDCILEDYFEYFISLELSIDAYPNYSGEFENLLSVSSRLLGKPINGEIGIEQKHEVYICYDDEDLDVASEVLHLFEENNINCWFRARDMTNLASVDDAISKSSLFVLIFSENSNNSNFVKTEIDIAFTYMVPRIAFKTDDFIVDLFFEFFISPDFIINAYPDYKKEFDNLLSLSLKALGKSINDSPIKKKRSIFSRFKRKKSKSNDLERKFIKLKPNGNDDFTYDVFINYSTKDYVLAEKICNFLEENGLKVWIAQRNLILENDVYTAIVLALKKSKVALLVFSKSSQESHHCIKDLSIAFNREKPIISLQVDETLPKGNMAFYLKNQRWIGFYYPLEDDFGELIDDIFEAMPEKSILVPGEGRRPFPAYRGNDEYAFVSYAHKDAKIVFPEIQRFQNLGYNIWYDEGIGAGNEWKKDIIAHLKNSKFFIVFVTNNSMASSNVQKEIKYAFKHNKNIIPIYLENHDDIEMEEDIISRLSSFPDIYKTAIEEEDYVSKAIGLFKEYSLIEETRQDIASSRDIKSRVRVEPRQFIESSKPLAYQGNGDYIFVSYSGDGNVVFPEIQRFQDLGYNIWYDEQIGAKSDLREVRDHLKNCKIFVVFVTNESMASEKVQEEIDYAIYNNKNIIPIYLEDYEDVVMEDVIDYELSAVPDICKTAIEEEEYVSKAIELFKKYGL